MGALEFEPINHKESSNYQINISELLEIEYAYYKLAKEAGIDISESILFEENDRFHFLTKRFDRTDSGEKIHMQSLGALAGIDYRIQKASSYETLFRVMKRLRLPYYQFEQQYRRAIFNVIARNHLASRRPIVFWMKL